MMMCRRLEALHHHLFERGRQQALDGPQQASLRPRDERQRPAGEASTAGATHPMHVVLGDEWQVEVHHQRQVHDVETAGGDVGGARAR